MIEYGGESDNEALPSILPEVHFVFSLFCSKSSKKRASTYTKVWNKILQIVK
jgi:hypothetical protein